MRCTKLLLPEPDEAAVPGERQRRLLRQLARKQHGLGVNVQPHNGSVRAIRVFGNTVVAAVAAVLSVAAIRPIRSSAGQCSIRRKADQSPTASAMSRIPNANASATLNNPIAPSASATFFQSGTVGSRHRRHCLSGFFRRGVGISTARLVIGRFAVPTLAKVQPDGSEDRDQTQ